MQQAVSLLGAKITKKRQLAVGALIGCDWTLQADPMITRLKCGRSDGFGNVLFEYDEDEMSQVVEEFYPVTKEADKEPVDGSSVVSKLQIVVVN